MNVSTKFPVEIGPIHFIGIGGIGMSGIAEILINQGYSVQGSDLRKTEITSRLEEMGACIKVGHDSDNLENAVVVVISSAINKENPDYLVIRYWLPFMAPCLGTIARLVNSNIKILAITDNIIPHEKRFGDFSLTKYFVKSCDAFLTLSAAVLDDLLKL